MGVCTVDHKILTSTILPSCIAHSPVGLVLLLEPMGSALTHSWAIEVGNHLTAAQIADLADGLAYFGGKDEGPIDLFRRNPTSCSGYVTGSAYEEILLPSIMH